MRIIFLFVVAYLGLIRAAFSIGDFGPDTCMEGLVWREACGPNDHVCATPVTRTNAQQDNRQAASRVSSTDHSFGPDTCIQGFVWREACGSSDHVCVKPEVRDIAAHDNASREHRRKHPYCRDYARDAKRAGEINERFFCRFSGPRWEASEANHFDFCMNALDRDIGGERFARYKELGDCNRQAEREARSIPGFPSTSPTPPPLGGTKCCFIPTAIPGGGIGTMYTCSPACP
jgi:hypothetical protein